jgi:hypothetical protein
MPTKTVQIDRSELWETVVYTVDVKCPYCGHINGVEEEHEPPVDAECHKCNKKFRIKFIKSNSK